MIIETIIHRCRDCASENIVKNGRNRYGSQQYLCKECHSSRVLTPNKNMMQARKSNSSKPLVNA